MRDETAMKVVAFIVWPILGPVLWVLAGAIMAAAWPFILLSTVRREADGRLVLRFRKEGESA